MRKDQLRKPGLSDLESVASVKAFIHHFSALSCWTEAGDLHCALFTPVAAVTSAGILVPMVVTFRGGMGLFRRHRPIGGKNDKRKG